MSARIAPWNDTANPINSKSLRYQAWVDQIRNLLDGKTPEEQKRAIAANEAFVRGLQNPRFRQELNLAEKAVTPTAVHVDTLLANFSVMYANEDYVGEFAMPEVRVSDRSNKFAIYPKRERFQYPDDVIGYRASPNELDATRETGNYSVVDYGFKNFLDLETAQNQDAPLNEMIDVVEAINEGIAFKREQRISALVEDAGSYGSNTAGAGTNWNDATGGTILADIQNAVTSVWRGPTPARKIGICPLAVWNGGIFNNPAFAERFKYTAGGPTLPQQVASFFGLDALYIAGAYEQTANEGQSASYSRMWATDVFAVISVARRPTVRSLHWGSTFRKVGDPVTTEWTDPGIGKLGGIWAKVAVSEDHKLVAGDAGFLITSILT